MDQWKKELTKQAREKKMCADNRAYLSCCENIHDVVRYYKQTIDWALEKDYPTLDVVRREFIGLESEGIYVDHVFNGEILKEHQVYVLHNCKGLLKLELNVETAINPIIYLGNGCDIIIEGLIINKPTSTKYSIVSFGDNIIKTINVEKVEYKIRKHKKL